MRPNSTSRRATLTVGLAKESHIEHPRRADPRADPRAQEKKEIVPQNEVQWTLRCKSQPWYCRWFTHPSLLACRIPNKKEHVCKHRERIFLFISDCRLVLNYARALITAQIEYKLTESIDFSDCIFLNAQWVDIVKWGKFVLHLSTFRNSDDFGCSTPTPSLPSLSSTNLPTCPPSGRCC